MISYIYTLEACLCVKCEKWSSSDFKVICILDKISRAKYQNSIRVYIREIISFRNSKLSLNLKFPHRANTARWRINATALYVILANVREEFSPSYICYRSSTLSVAKASSSVFTQKRMSPFHARYHGRYDNWKVEMHPLSRYSTVRFITLLSFELRSYCFDEGRKATCRL